MQEIQNKLAKAPASIYNTRKKSDTGGKSCHT